MNKIKLNSYYQIQALFLLLNLPGSDQVLREKYDRLGMISLQKDQLVSAGAHEQAAEKRKQELQEIEDIVMLLNESEKLKDNYLEILLELSE